MKKLTVFETTIIGLLVGVVVSAYITFVMGTDGFLGTTLEFISLKPLLDGIQIQIPEDKFLLVSFLFFVAVYALYGAIIGIIAHVSGKMRVLIIPAVLLLAAGAFLEQTSGSSPVTTLPDTTYDQTAALIQARQKASAKKYFGTEATGDLNADGTNDVAFLIHRNDKKNGPLYYLSSALTTESGRSGTNMLYLGPKAEPRSISISEGTIIVEYAEKGSNATNTERFRAGVIDGSLAEIVETATTSVSSLSPLR